MLEILGRNLSRAVSPLRIRYIGVDVCFMDGLVPVGSSSKLFYFR